MATEVKDIIADLTRADITREEVHAYYEKWTTYNDDVDAIYHGPRYVAEQLNKYCNDKRARILDMAAGTGILAKQLISFGFKNIDALEPSAQMLQQARQTGFYKEFYQDFMGKNRLAINDGTYDAITASGSMIPGHVGDDSFEEILRILKPGGYLIFSLQRKYEVTAPEWTKQFETRMKDLEKEGKWKIVVQKEKENYIDHSDYGCFVFVIQKP